MVRREGIALQKGMNFRVKHSYSIVLMSVRKGAPYQDQWLEDRGLLEYEGHDASSNAVDDPKAADQPLALPSGKPTENGKFFRAVLAYKQSLATAEIVQVYEKIATGIWSDRGRHELVDAAQVSVPIHRGRRDSRQRLVCRFYLRPTTTPEVQAEQQLVDLITSRQIPTTVKVEVWKRDRGRCVTCGATDNLHFDHDVPWSKGGSSITAQNVKLLCARHNLQKAAKIQ